MHDHAAIEALTVDAGRIPQAEEIVGAARRGMEEIECPRIECQFLQQRKIEVGLPQQLFRRLFQDRHRILHEPTVAAVRGAHAADEQRDRTDALVGIGLREPTVLQHRHRPPADVVVEPADGLLHNAFGSDSRRITGKNGLRRRHQEEGPLQTTGWLMLEQIAVERTVGRQQSREEHVQHHPGLAGITECRLGRCQRLQPLGEKDGHAGRSIGPLRDLPAGGAGVVPGGRLHGRKEVVHCAPDGRIEGPGREVQIPEENSGWIARPVPFRIGPRIVPEIAGRILPHRHGASSFHGRPGAARAAGKPLENLEFSSFAGHEFVG